MYLVTFYHWWPHCCSCCTFISLAVSMYFSLFPFTPREYLTENLSNPYILVSINPKSNRRHQIASKQSFSISEQTDTTSNVQIHGLDLGKKGFTHWVTMLISVTLHNNTHVACESRLQTTHTHTQRNTHHLLSVPSPISSSFSFQNCCSPISSSSSSSCGLNKSALSPLLSGSMKNVFQSFGSYSPTDDVDRWAVSFKKLRFEFAICTRTYV